MRQGYLECANERGTGSFMRMKSHMANHVERVKAHMFCLASGEGEPSLLATSQPDSFLPCVLQLPTACTPSIC